MKTQGDLETSLDLAYPCTWHLPCLKRRNTQLNTILKTACGHQHHDLVAMEADISRQRAGRSG